MTILGNLLTPYAQEYIDKHSPKSKKELQKQLKKMSSEIEVSLPSNYRVVIGKDLYVRQKPNKKSAVIGNLSCGKLVRFIEKRRNWTLVEVSVSDNAGDILIGWVFTRYLAPISK